ncbi:MAG: hypothetical protein ACO31C_04830 [Schleiferiaceae bacterium]
MLPKGTDVHLDALRLEIQRRFGRPVRTKTDCQLLEEQLYETLGAMVSYNTLRRFFGLVPGGTSRGAVLDILSAYCGFPNFQAFTSDVRRFQFYYDWTRTIDREVWTEADRDQLLARVALEDFNAQTIFLWILYKLTRSAPVRDWFFWLEHPVWTSNELTKAQLVFFSNSLADEFRERLADPAEMAELTQSPASFRWVCHFFADYDTLQSGYMANAVSAMSERIEVPLYYHGLCTMQHFLGGTWSEILPHADASVAAGFTYDDYPILISRYFAARFWAHYLRQGTWDPQLTADYLVAARAIDPSLHYLLGMEFLPVASVMGFHGPVLQILDSNVLKYDLRSTWSAAVDADLVRLARMLAYAQQGHIAEYLALKNQLQADFWYKAYRTYLQALCAAGDELAGVSGSPHHSSLATFPGIQRAISNRNLIP